jgi:hypothetical protein
VPAVLLWTFQPLERVAALEADGVLTGSWEHVPASTGDAIRTAYREMVAAMERAGIATAGRPPVWAWSGRCGVTVDDALMLVGEPMWDGYATIEFAAPESLAHATDYGAWCDYMSALFDGPAAPRGWDAPTPIDGEPVQVSLPAIRAEWVREIRPLPRSPAEVTDSSARA